MITAYRAFVVFITLFVFIPDTAFAQAADPLPSWNQGQAKQSILDFVAAAITEGSPNFIPPEQRIATFDNDGTLWCEQPMYVQLAFALDRVKVLAPMHPEWREEQPFKAALDGDTKALAAAGEHGMMELIMVSHAGMTTDQFEQIVKDWLAYRSPPALSSALYRSRLSADDRTAHLSARERFQNFVVSGGGIEFMRPWVRQAYGVPPDQVVGSSIKTRFQMDGDIPVLYRLPEINFVNDGPGKPVGINEHIGQHPIAAFGNSDGDLEMLQWTTMTGPGAHLGMIIHHTDAEREYAYDRNSSFGRLDKALNAAPAMGWVVIDMKQDWKRIFSFE